MKVIFYGHRQGNTFDKLIRWWTSDLRAKFNGNWRDSYSHVEILFSDGYMFSASQYENATRFKGHMVDTTKWAYIDMDVSPETEKLVRMYCERRNNKEYDYMGILGFVIGAKHDADKYFCSEICTEALQFVDFVPFLKSYKTSPNGLYKAIKGIK